MTTQEILSRAAECKAQAALLTSSQKNEALLSMAEALIRNAEAILSANSEDIAAAKMPAVMLDRLMLNQSRIEGMAQGLREVMALPDPVNVTLSEITRPNGLVIQKKSVPMGVIAIIYESRPNVTSDAAGLALKAGSCSVLRCGKEAWRTCHAIVEALRQGLESLGLPSGLIQLVEDTSRSSAVALMRAVGYVDLLIPRGGKSLIQACVEGATVPCIQTGTGICHVYVDASANLPMALDVIENAKTSRPSVCNAEEVCLVHRDIAPRFLPMLQKRLVADRMEKGICPVELRLDPEAESLIPGKAAGAEDFDTEFLDYVLAVAVVGDADEAIAHIGKHSTHHSDAVIAEDEAVLTRFASLVDSAAVYLNASTRFTDGGVFGLGCEMGISTQKLHARGPMGLEELCAYKYVIRGNGQIR